MSGWGYALVALTALLAGATGVAVGFIWGARTANTLLQAQRALGQTRP